MADFARHVFCEAAVDLDGLSAEASSKVPAGTIDTVWSVNRGVSQALGNGLRWRSPETLVERRRLETFWRRVMDLVEPAITVTQDLENSDPAFRSVSAVLPAQIISQFRSIGAKAIVLEAWRNHVCGAGIVCGDGSLSGVTGLAAMVDRLGNVSAAIADAANDGDSASFHRWQSASSPTVSANQLLPPPDKRDRFFNIVNRSGSAFGYQIWRRLGAPLVGFGSHTVAILAPNEMIEESFLALLSRRNIIVSLQLPDLRNLSARGLPEGATERLESLWNKATDGLLCDQLRTAAWRVMAPRLTAVAERVPDASRRLEEWVRAHPVLSKADERPVTVLSNGLYAAPERIFDAVVRRQNIPVVCTDHGIGVGIGRRHENNARLVTCFADAYLTHNSKTASIYTGRRHRKTQRYQAIGSPIVTRRARFRRFQRSIYRRAFGVKSGERLLLYVANLSANNMHQGCGTSTDTELQDFQKKLIKQLEHFPGRSAIKPYPAHRYADPEPVWYAQETDKITIAPAGEFRQQRWAADLLLLDLGSSTLGWALGTEIPLVYVDNVSNPLSPEARRLLANSVFLVDALEPGWENMLNEILATPLADLKRQWAGKKEARRRFSTEFGLGPAGAVGSRIAQAIGKTISRPVTAPPQDIGVHH